MLIYILFLLLIFIIYKKINYTDGKFKRIKKLNKIKINNRKNLEKILDNRFTKEDEIYLLKLFNNRCFNCGKKKGLTIDHHMPLSTGYGKKLNDGSYNAVILCKKCNEKKSNLLPRKFYTKDQLKDLTDNYGIDTHNLPIKNIAKSTKSILKDMIKHDKIVEFDYLGKKIKGKPLAFYKDDKGFNKKSVLYVKIEENDFINLYVVNNIKDLRLFENNMD